MLKVYLDTSDYAVLYKERCTPELAHVKRRLLGFVDSGKIMIGFSFPIIFELLQDCTPEFLSDRLERARILKRLCKTNCFPYLVIFGMATHCLTMEFGFRVRP